MMKKYLCFVISISLLLMSISGICFVTYAELQGSGTEEDPYIIASYEDFNTNLTGDKSGIWYEIQGDITLLEDYTPRVFKGNIRGAEKADGSKYKITLNITTSNDNAGIFSTFSGKFSNLELDGSVISTGTKRAGAVVGYVDVSAEIADCINNASVYITSSYAGGFVGVANTLTITNCINNASITADDNYAGGIAGYTLGNCLIQNCVNNGDVTVKIKSATGNVTIGGITAYVGTGDKVENCTNNAKVYYSSETGGTNAYIGGIAGWYRYGSVTNCINSSTAEVKVVNSSDTANVSIGGIIGIQGAGITLSGCKNYGTVSGLSKTTNYIGGIAGNNSGTVTKCVNYSDNVSGYYAGGIAGRHAAGTVSLCYNTGDMTSATHGGGLVSRQDAGTTITNCFNIGNVTGTKSGGLTSLNRGTLSNSYTVCNSSIANGVTYEQTGTLSNVYYVINENGSLSNTTQCGTLATFDELIANTAVFSSDNGWSVLAIDDTNQYPLPQLTENLYLKAYEIPEKEQENTTDYAGGLGTDDKPYLIENEKHFLNIAKNDAAGVYFKLNGNITVSTPVATLNGIFDGDNKTITLNIDTTAAADTYTGLFAQLEKTATVKNLVLCGNVKGTQYVGAVAGNSNATSTAKSNITNVINNADVDGNYAGGIIGNNYSVIENCVNNGTVSSTGAAGGIAGYSYWTIIESYNTGRVVSSSPTMSTGGIAGHLRNNSAYIDTCYNIGTVIGYKAVGLAGSFSQDNSIIKISNSFNAGAVIRQDGSEPVIQRHNTTISDTNKPELSNVYYLTATAYDDGYENTENITSKEALSELKIDGFTTGGTYPVITDNIQETIDSIVKLSVTSGENGETSLYGLGAVKERFIKAGETVTLNVTPDSDYMGSISCNGSLVKSDIISAQSYLSSELTADTQFAVSFEVRPATDKEEIKITTVPSLFIPDVIEEGEEYTIKNQDGEYTVKAGAKYTAVFSKINEYYGWEISDYGIEINETKYPSKLNLTDKLSYGIVVENVPDNAVIKAYAVYYDIDEAENTITVYSDVAVQAE